jgi:hypothetical protein
VISVVRSIVFLLKKEVVIMDANFDIIVNLIREAMVGNIKFQNGSSIDMLSHERSFWERYFIIFNFLFNITNWLNRNLISYFFKYLL